MAYSVRDSECKEAFIIFYEITTIDFDFLILKVCMVLSSSREFLNLWSFCGIVGYKTMVCPQKFRSRHNCLGGILTCLWVWDLGPEGEKALFKPKSATWEERASGLKRDLRKFWRAIQKKYLKVSTHISIWILVHPSCTQYSFC